MLVIPQRIGIVQSIVLFGLPALLLWATTGLLIPLLVQGGWAPQAAWFLAGAMVFVPLLVAALAGAWAALPSAFRGDDSEPSAGAPHDSRRLEADGYVFLFIGGATAALYVVNASVWPRLPPHSPFLTASALEPAYYYLLLLWVPFFTMNIIGEELWWRGFIQPRQEPKFGRFTWIIQGVLHPGFHFSFGLGLILILLPTVFALPWACSDQRIRQWESCFTPRSTAPPSLRLISG